MCGIAALLSFKPDLDLSSIGRMTDQIRHRGPDDEGFALFFKDQPVLALGGADTPREAFVSELLSAPRGRLEPGAARNAIAAFGHRRLSILDLSVAGHQPMASADGRYWITYNGEIYNYRELRAELEAKGHRFVSQTDTEVILAAYAEWGKECLHRFNGMWAFVLADRETGRFFAARDRFGVKPLYYWVAPEGFVAFASEIKQFTVLPGWSARVNGQRAYDFLRWALTDHTEETLFRDVFQLRGGEALELDLNAPIDRLPVYRWYSLAPRPFRGGMEAAVEEFRDLLRDAVSLRLRADVSVGSCLSGGLDSSSIVCLVNDLLVNQGKSEQQKTFSACTEVKRFDEREYIDEVVRSREIEAHYTYPAHESLFENLESMAWHQDEPFASTSIFAQWQVFGLAAEHGVKVMLDGQGADEQLAGYHAFFAPRFASLFRSLSWVTLWSEIRAAEAVHGYRGWDAVKRIANATLPAPLLHALGQMRGNDGTAPEWMDLTQLAAVPLNPVAKHGVAPNTIQKLSHAQLTATNLPMLLHWEDRDSMAHAVESRVPFLDYRLVEFVLGLPDEAKLANGVTKRVLREAMRGILPERIRTRMDKMGFVTAEEVWLREKAPERFRQALRRAMEVSQGVITPEAMVMLERMISGEIPFSYLPWRLISFGAWVEAFDVKVG